ncbi:protein BRI1-5 ENHANCED 1 [Citrus sinensis]|uniref:Protein BRI1-5 ENHANCED 1 n=1 Tax=Citrus sinensis TaxID=2711 RepID=A0ACB8ILT5_CITSI|nr:protein BRI1-5 ENHANCED 1 [Citrus sinensis]
MEEQKGKVCVTGGTGFIGSWLIMRLLDHGYSVTTTVRSDPEHKKDLSFLTNLPGASERLQIFNADLNDPESFDEAIAGCAGVIHVAAPIDIDGKETEEVMTQRAVNGTIGILKSCLKSGTVKRFVYTSSGSTVYFSGKDVDMLDETFWSDEDYIRKLDIWGKSYVLTKTLTERAALEFAEEHGLDLVTLIPSFVVGPFICPKFAGSVRSTLAMVLGTCSNLICRD